MRFFLSAGEPSGDVHGANLARSLHALSSHLHLEGFGGERMRQAGCDLLYPLCEHAVMGFGKVFAEAVTFLSLLSRADRYFRHHRPDALILIDYPGFHWWLARRAHFHKIPVFYFVPPQLWAWAGWRVKKMRRFVDHVMCNLPFEEAWYRQRGVTAHYVGHPFFDELIQQQLSTDFLTSQRQRPGTVVAILPGSRRQEVQNNLDMQLEAAQRIHDRRPETRFLMACFRTEHQKMAHQLLKRYPRLPVETHVGRTPEIIELAHSCLAVSGSVSLELLYRGTPTVVVYKVGRIINAIGRRIAQIPYITLVNLLANKALFPEFPTTTNVAPQMAQEVLRWLEDENAYAVTRAELAALKQQVAQPGACRRGAEFILEKMTRRAAA